MDRLTNKEIKELKVNTEIYYYSNRFFKGLFTVIKNDDDEFILNKNNMSLIFKWVDDSLLWAEGTKADVEIFKQLTKYQMINA